MLDVHNYIEYLSLMETVYDFMKCASICRGFRIHIIIVLVWMCRDSYWAVKLTPFFFFFFPRVAGCIDLDGMGAECKYQSP